MANILVMGIYNRHMLYCKAATAFICKAGLLHATNGARHWHIKESFAIACDLGKNARAFYKAL